MFIRSALREEKEQRNTILLETHSEHLMLRILRRIRETSETSRYPKVSRPSIQRTWPSCMSNPVKVMKARRSLRYQ